MAQRKSQQPHSQERAWQPGPAQEKGVLPGGRRGGRERRVNMGLDEGALQKKQKKKEGSIKDAERWETTKEGRVVSGGVIAAALRKSKTGHSDERWMKEKTGVESGGDSYLCVQKSEKHFLR